ncbi:unnamed protein product [Owenia fusiformis]|uniref:K Homology domain-containing protein n=1 Tax=Owenia fusiformis TaxID=6347 RepID=A0A8S4PEC8_OWEFU|nr:unnamed protein product [Owenia fusiformis]
MSFNQDVAMDSSDSRKRPLDGENEGGISKKSNQGPDGGIHVKVLVPSIAAGAIIGKGGETIAQIQKEAGAKMKMSKANDYYPGTTERVCLMTGTHDQVNRVADFVLEKIREKPDPNPRPVDGELKVNQERHKQVKILVPNSTAGMIIGKSGSFIKQIKDDSGAYVQISQKAKDMNLQERCVTIAGDEVQNKKALQMIIQKITEDPQSGSCPNISYTDFHGPVASANPTGSPFAGAVPQRMEVGGQGYSPGQNFPGGLLGAGGNFTNGGGPNNIGSGINNLNLNSSIGTNGRGIAMPGLESLRTTLRASGFSDMAIEEICQAMCTLSSYNLLGAILPFLGDYVVVPSSGDPLGFTTTYGGWTYTQGLIGVLQNMITNRQ